MCGIIGISSNKSVSANIINSLKKLEYRGYDSAGIATLSEGIINEVKSKGRVDNLEKNSVDFYASVKSIYLQDRQNKIKNIQRGSIEVIYKEDEGWEEIDAK